MSESQHIYRVGRGIMTVQRDIPRVPERDDELAQLRQLRKRSPHAGAGFQQREDSFDGLAGAPGCQRILRHQEPTAALQALRGSLGDDYSWHFGSSTAASVPQVFSHARTSCPVRC